MKSLKILAIVIVSVVLLIAIAGFIKFNILQDDIFIENEHGEIIRLK